MRKWYVGFNNYWFTASIHLEEVPMGLCFLEWLVGWICSIVPPIKLPKIRFKLKDKKKWEWIDSKDGWTDLQEWYGDLNQIWHCFVCIPVINLVWKYTKTKAVNLPFNFVLEKFPSEYIDDSYYEDDEDLAEIKKNKKDADQLDKEFRKVYNKLGFKYLI
jgi:hypothetical protein